ncbi:MAG: hypothetical protein QMD10_12245 [Desulfitobacteriaceae bacterium]|nr:hypothetical protein [Desulfitobacteriaceae bacterium]
MLETGETQVADWYAIARQMTRAIPARDREDVIQDIICICLAKRPVEEYLVYCLAKQVVVSYWRKGRVGSSNYRKVCFFQIYMPAADELLVQVEIRTYARQLFESLPPAFQTLVQKRFFGAAMTGAERKRLWYWRKWLLKEVIRENRTGGSISG